MRDPVLHIKRSDLIKILLEVMFASEFKAVSMADSIFEAAQPYQITDRYALYAKSVNQKKFIRAVESETDYVEIFNRVLNAQRTAANHKFIQAIKKDDSNYIMLKEITQAAIDFANVFNISPIEEGFKKFIDIGLHLMGKKYSLNRFKWLKTKIHETAESITVIDGDPDKNSTQEFIAVWAKILLEKTSVPTDYNKISPDKLVNFIFGKTEAEEKGAVYNDWILAQFEELEWLNAIPELTQLYGENAKLRYDKFVARHNIKKSKEDEHKVTEYGSDAEREFYELLRQEKST